ncbi:hypothetical protein ATO49_00325 [Mycolicibacterium fortuitum subsp. fortuitum DSM 46621 = ATCC 6841 = JCM 6387]|nr:hypothetical protein ATO49_00325 [Mycolicibacterium fortuitum subsp. fortuitum DSM 46621 = ATCC 6841 = JCM 6387]
MRPRRTPEDSAANGASEVSTATRQSSGASRETISAYQPAGIPGGNEPDNTTQDAPWALASTQRVSADSASPSTTAPRSLSLVVVPSDSVIARLVRTGSEMGTPKKGTASPRSALTKGSESAAGSTASAATPASVKARATLIPLPPGSTVTESTRCTAPRINGDPKVTVRSRLGLGVTVMIMRSRPLPRARRALRGRYR